MFESSENIRIELIEVDNAEPMAGYLFKKSFGAEIPNIPRHFLLLAINERGHSLTIGYGHVNKHKNIYLGGGMCVDPQALRKLPKELRKQLTKRGGAAFTLCSSIVNTVDDCDAVFAYVGHKGAYKIDLAVGFVQTQYKHLIVYWKKQLTPEQQQPIIEEANSLGPF